MSSITEIRCYLIINLCGRLINERRDEETKVHPLLYERAPLLDELRPTLILVELVKSNLMKRSDSSRRSSSSYAGLHKSFIVGINDVLLGLHEQ